ncbi:GTP-binding protein 2-like [Artemia franciscana]|uniref:GTP-binding protein 2-like n=1 Tax=Artemia franciscana TaxID=6661 RepID=UPI0032DAB030
MTKSLDALRKIASEIGATAYVKFQASVAEDKSFVKVIVRKLPKADQNCPETRIALLGKKDAGKSTLIHVLLKGMLDDGHGSRCKDAVKRPDS